MLSVSDLSLVSFVFLIAMNFFSKSFDPVTDLPDMSGKVVLITGGK
jgi:hypothetical protein